jgi:hypothetical protein
LRQGRPGGTKCRPTRSPARSSMAARPGVPYQEDYCSPPRFSWRGCGGVWRSIRLGGTPSATIARLSPPSRTESPSMKDEEQAPQAGTPAAPADAGETPLEKLEALGVRGILRQLARDRQIIDVRCEMPQCYCFRGRSYFEPRSARPDWEPTADHYPRLRAHGGHLTPDNVRLAHRLCNRRDYTWRMKINELLGKRMSLEEIAEKLNAERVPTIHGTNRWTAASVRKPFVS